VVLAKMDAESNDAPDNFEVQGFPTIYFKPAGKKSQPIKYDSQEREIDDLFNFIKKNAKTQFSFPTKKKKDSIFIYQKYKTTF